MQVDSVNEADEQLFEAFRRLVPQLTNNNPPPSFEDLKALVRDPASMLLVAREDDGAILGALTLVVYRVPTGVRSVIEDVIVDDSMRGRGIGEALMKRAISLAMDRGASIITLTSNPMREAANRLYLRMGFKKRETNAYVLKLI